MSDVKVKYLRTAIDDSTFARCLKYSDISFQLLWAQTQYLWRFPSIEMVFGDVRLVNDLARAALHCNWRVAVYGSASSTLSLPTLR